VPWVYAAALAAGCGSDETPPPAVPNVAASAGEAGQPDSGGEAGQPDTGSGGSAGSATGGRGGSGASAGSSGDAGETGSDGGAGGTPDETGGTGGSSAAGGASGANTGGNAGSSGASQSGAGGNVSGTGGGQEGGAAGEAASGGSAGVGGGGAGGGSGGGNSSECEQAADCVIARGGPSACGDWTCEGGVCRADAANCTDDDGDGYGAGNTCACAGLDCNDDDPDVLDSGREICAVSTGPHGGCFESLRTCSDGAWGACRAMPGEMPIGGEACNGEDEDCDGEIDEDLGDFSCGIGACRRTVKACVAGTVSACIPGAPEAQTDGCNGEDDDCDGAVDEDCTTCIKVAPNGDDGAATASNGASPFLTVQAAIDFADSHRSIATRVCVAAGTACGASATYAGPSGDLTMRDGIDVYGNYESSGWTRCANSTTTLAPTTALGVLFPSGISTRTILDGFTVLRLVTSTTTGITVDGATNVLLSNLVVDDGPVVVSSYGVNLVGGADATIFRSRIGGGRGSSEAIGVRSVGSRVVVEDNCLSPDPTTGRCDDLCDTGPAITGRLTLDRDVPSTAILLDSSPGSRVERSAVCSYGPTLFPGQIAGILIAGDGDGILIRGNTIDASGGSDTRTSGVGTDGCGGGKPWLVDNHAITAWTLLHEDFTLAAIRSFGDCHPVVDSNREIVAVPNVIGYGVGTAIHAGAVSQVPSRIVIAGNPNVYSAGAGYNSTTTPNMRGIWCQGGSCSKISRNGVTGRASHPRNVAPICITTCRDAAFAVTLEGGGAFVDRNVINAGCARSGRTFNAEDVWSRIQNNRITGATCGPVIELSYAMRLTLTANGNEPDIHSNQLSNPGGATSCGVTVLGGSVVLVAGTSAPVAPLGIFRNNDITDASPCGPFIESAFSTDPRVLENNRLRGSSGSFVYADEVSTWLSIGQVNALTDTTSSDNVNVYLEDLGTTTEAPLFDLDGNPRGPLPDIGPVETKF